VNYLDFLNFGFHQIPTGLPRIFVWKGDMVKKFLKRTALMALILVDVRYIMVASQEADSQEHENIDASEVDQADDCVNVVADETLTTLWTLMLRLIRLTTLSTAILMIIKETLWTLMLHRTTAPMLQTVMMSNTTKATTVILPPHLRCRQMSMINNRTMIATICIPKVQKRSLPLKLLV
ncbi:hypothetical protein E2562_028140, partial [Oryza meyeriana var. granulata]